MGFSGGGSNVLKSHTHDGTIVQDGGSLDFGNVTQSQSAAGQVFYSDGNHLQQLSLGAASDVLQVNAGVTAPEWVTPAAGTNNRVILDSQTFTASTTQVITFTPGSPIEDDTYQKIQVVFTGDGLGNTIQRCVIRLDSGLTNTNYNENSMEIFNGIQQIMNRNPQSIGDDYIRLTDQLANGGEGWICSVDLEIPPATATGTSLWYQVANHDRVAIGAGWITGLTAGQIGRIQIEVQGANNKDMQFTVYGIKF
jgi:peptidoglycan hydrolase-like protein with peptidoglycan-binding domain